MAVSPNLGGQPPRVVRGPRAVRSRRCRRRRRDRDLGAERLPVGAGAPAIERSRAAPIRSLTRVDRAGFRVDAGRGDRIEFPFRFSGWWLSLAERCVRDAEVGSSNLPHPTKVSAGQSPVHVVHRFGDGPADHAQTTIASSSSSLVFADPVKAVRITSTSIRRSKRRH